MFIRFIRPLPVFHSLLELNAAIVCLINMDDNVPIRVIRVKDRVSEPLESGYRDVLLNVVVDGCDMVMELQLHLRDVIAIKKIGHRTYGGLLLADHT